MLIEMLDFYNAVYINILESSFHPLSLQVNHIKEKLIC